MTDPDERAINRVIALVPNDWQDEREEARAALHRLFRDRRRLENRVAELEAAIKGELEWSEWVTSVKPQVSAGDEAGDLEDN